MKDGVFRGCWALRCFHPSVAVDNDGKATPTPVQALKHDEQTNPRPTKQSDSPLRAYLGVTLFAAYSLQRREEGSSITLLSSSSIPDHDPSKPKLVSNPSLCGSSSLLSVATPPGVAAATSAAKNTTIDPNPMSSQNKPSTSSASTPMYSGSNDSSSSSSSSAACLPPPSPHLARLLSIPGSMPDPCVTPPDYSSSDDENEYNQKMIPLPLVESEGHHNDGTHPSTSSSSTLARIRSASKVFVSHVPITNESNYTTTTTSPFASSDMQNRRLSASSSSQSLSVQQQPTTNSISRRTSFSTTLSRRQTSILIATMSDDDEEEGQQEEAQAHDGTDTNTTTTASLQRKLSAVYSGHHVNVKVLRRQIGNPDEPPKDLLSCVARQVFANNPAVVASGVSKGEGEGEKEQREEQIANLELDTSSLPRIKTKLEIKEEKTKGGARGSGSRGWVIEDDSNDDDAIVFLPVPQVN